MFSETMISQFGMDDSIHSQRDLKPFIIHYAHKVTTFVLLGEMLDSFAISPLAVLCSVLLCLV